MGLIKTYPTKRKKKKKKEFNGVLYNWTIFIFLMNKIVLILILLCGLMEIVYEQWTDTSSIDKCCICAFETCWSL